MLQLRLIHILTDQYYVYRDYTMPNIQDWAIDVTPGQAPTMPPSHTPSNDSDTLLSPSLCPSSSQLAAAATSDTDSCVDSIVRLYFPYSSCCWRFLFFKDLDCISSDDDGIIAAAEAVMNEAQETVALLEHQTMVAENAYTQMIVAADSFRTYALRPWVRGSVPEVVQV